MRSWTATRNCSKIVLHQQVLLGGRNHSTRRSTIASNPRQRRHDRHTGPTQPELPKLLLSQRLTTPRLQHQRLQQHSNKRLRRRRRQHKHTRKLTRRLTIRRSMLPSLPTLDRQNPSFSEQSTDSQLRFKTPNEKHETTPLHMDAGPVGFEPTTFGSPHSCAGARCPILAVLASPVSMTGAI